MCVFTSTLCTLDLRKGDLFVLSWARVQPMCPGSVSSVVFIGGGMYCWEVGVYVLFCKGFC